MTPCPVYLNAVRYPAKVAIAWRGRSIFWGAVNAYVHSTARYLKEIAVRPQTRILLLAEASPSYFIVLTALWRIGACSCLIEPCVSQEPGDVCTVAKPELVISSRANRGRWSQGHRWTDIEQAVAYGYNDLFLGSEGALGATIAAECPLVLRLQPEKTLMSYAMLQADPGDLKDWLQSLETGAPLTIHSR